MASRFHVLQFRNRTTIMPNRRASTPPLKPCLLLQLPSVLMREICTFLSVSSALSAMAQLNRSVRSSLLAMPPLRLTFGSKFSAPSLRPLATTPLAKHLSSLSLGWSSKLSAADLSVVAAALPQLTSLQALLAGEEAAHWIFPAGMQSLSLQIECVPRVDRSRPGLVAHLDRLAFAVLSVLHSLSLTSSCASLEALRAHPLLSRLDLTQINGPISLDQADVIRSMPELKSLSINWGNIWFASLCSLLPPLDGSDPASPPAALRQLQHINLCGTSLQNDDDWTSVLARLPALTTLSPQRIHSRSLALLRSLRFLTSARLVVVSSSFPSPDAIGSMFEADDCAAKLQHLTLRVADPSQDREALAIKPAVIVRALSASSCLRRSLQTLELGCEGVSGAELASLLLHLSALRRFQLDNQTAEAHPAVEGMYVWHETSPAARIKQLAERLIRQSGTEAAVGDKDAAATAGTAASSASASAAASAIAPPPAQFSALSELQLEDALFAASDLRALLAVLPHLRCLRLGSLPSLRSVFGVVAEALCCRSLSALHVRCAFLDGEDVVRASLQPLAHLAEFSLPAAYLPSRPASRQSWRSTAAASVASVHWTELPIRGLDAETMQLLQTARGVMRNPDAETVNQ